MLIPVMPEIGIISSSGNDIKWTIQDFFSLPENYDAWYCTPLFSFGGHTWNLTIYLYLQSNPNASKYVGLHLSRRSVGTPSRLNFSISIIAVNGDKYNETHSTKDFGVFSTFESHLFVSKSELFRRRSELVPFGVLTLVCTMRTERCSGTTSGYLQHDSFDEHFTLRNNGCIPIMPGLGEISTSVNSLGVNIEWTIRNLFSLPENYGPWHCSPTFSFSGHTWYLRIYLYIKTNPNGREYVGLNLTRCTSGPCSRQEFSLSIKTVNGEKSNETHSTIFEYSRFDSLLFLSKSELSSSRRLSELMPSGILTLVCSMRRGGCAGTSSNATSESAECCHCKETFDAERMPSHQKKCMHRPIKCPDCLEVVVMQNWLDEHECQEKRPEGEANVSGSFINPHEKKVLHDYKDLFLKKEDCDVIIKVDEQEFPAHRLILRARSPVFASTFRHDMKENVTSIVEIEDCDPSSFSDFLCFLYCGDVQMISQENVFSLFTVADKYEVLDLRVESLEFMKKNLTIDVFCEAITLALLHNETELIDLATDFFVKNAEQILVTAKWQTFAAKNPTQSNEFFLKFVKSVKYSLA